MVADPQRVLVANRGEIAVRVGRAARALNMTPVAVFSEDDADAPYLRSFGERVQLAGAGVPPYLDVEGMVQVAVDNQCGMLHPGYGFLSENPKLPSTCAAAGVIFVGASAEVLQLFGDKAKCRAFAEQCEVPVLPGTTTVDLPGAQEFMRATGGAVMVKALAGGGGRGMRPAHNAEELTQVWEQCQSEAKGAFGDDSLYVEQLAQGARHLEVQLLADRDQAMHLWERDCSLQRRRQKLVEMAPALGLPQSLLQQLRDDALKLARKAHMQGLATAEFLVWQGAGRRLAARLYRGESAPASGAHGQRADHGCRFGGDAVAAGAGQDSGAAGAGQRQAAAAHGLRRAAAHQRRAHLGGRHAGAERRSGRNL